MFQNWFDLMIEGLNLLESPRVLLMGSALVCVGLARRWCCCSVRVRTFLVSVVDFNGLNGCMRLDRIMEGLRSCGYCVCVGFVSYGSVTSDSSGDGLLFLILPLFVFWLLMQVVCSL